MSILVRPVSWHQSSSTVEISGYTPDGRSIFVQVVTHSTYILRFNETISENSLTNITELFRPTSVKQSKVVPNTVTIRSAEPISVKTLSNHLEIRVDPYDPIQSLWEARELTPYDWLVIYRYSPLPKNYTTADLNISVIEEDMFTAVDEHTEVPTRYIFASFLPDDISKEIKQIEMVMVNSDGISGYVITCDGSLPAPPSMVVVNANNERNLFVKFFALYNTFQPDRFIYQGDGLNYLRERLAANNHPPFSVTGVDNIDLLQYYHKFYPHLRGYTIQDIAGKRTVKGQTDILSMVNLFFDDNVNDDLESLCDDLCVDLTTCLKDDVPDIINKLAFNIDPGTVFATGEISRPGHIKSASPGIYRNVYVYDYGGLYLDIMLTSRNPFVVKLAEYLTDSPSSLIVAAFYSIYVDRTELLPILDELLNTILSSNTIIALKPFTILSTTVIDEVREVDKLPYYVVLDSESTFTLTEDNVIETNRLDYLQFGLIQDVVRDYLLSINSTNTYTLPDLSTISQEKFVLQEYISTSNRLTEEMGTRQVLAAQYGKVIATWIAVKYIMTTDGPKLLSLLKEDTKIDYDYYEQILQQQIANLQVLTIY